LDPARRICEGYASIQLVKRPLLQLLKAFSFCRELVNALEGIEDLALVKGSLLGLPEAPSRGKL
jgi:hypothetical protein